ncbi:MAG: RnfABCDGE type electron transport complex subunit D [Treponema sp.]|jgi:electron transport complex protein RnfD|nr:RnfABCDGE type electron transport complex subunit D [Treponema sp.]
MAEIDSKEQKTTQGIGAQGSAVPTKPTGNAAASGAGGKKLLQLSPSPHIATPTSAATLMRNMLVALAPAAIFGCVIFGLPALLNIAVSVASAMSAEAAFRRILKRESKVRDLSAAVTGLLLALAIPPATPLWMTALGAIFAVVVVKEFFGGLGSNVFNPALSARAFLLMSFPAALTEWNKPNGLAAGIAAGFDAATTATPLNIIKQGGGIAGVADSFGGAADYASVIKTLFIGNRGGSTGETSILLILTGAAYLLATKTIDWRAPLAMIAAVAAGSFALGLDPLFGVLSGGVLFGAVFMATDYTTAPLTAKGKLLFGAGAGLITVVIRKWGAFPEGVTYGILIMNAFTPFLNKLLSRKYGYIPRKKPSASATTSVAEAKEAGK